MRARTSRTLLCLPVRGLRQRLVLLGPVHQQPCQPCGVATRPYAVHELNKHAKGKVRRSTSLNASRVPSYKRARSWAAKRTRNGRSCRQQKAPPSWRPRLSACRLERTVKLNVLNVGAGVQCPSAASSTPTLLSGQDPPAAGLLCASKQRCSLNRTSTPRSHVRPSPTSVRGSLEEQSMQSSFPEAAPAYLLLLLLLLSLSMSMARRGEPAEGAYLRRSRWRRR